MRCRTPSRRRSPLKFAGASVAAGAARRGVSGRRSRRIDAFGLRERNAELTEQLAQDEELRQENERLRGLLELKAPTPRRRGRPRDGRSANAYSQTVTIDAGEAPAWTRGSRSWAPAAWWGR